MYGWMGSVLRVDLSKGKTAVRALDPVFARRFLGGRGFNSRVLWEEIRPGTNPFSPENVLCIAPGMLTGTPLALTGRVSVSTLSPLTGILGDGSGGGEFAWQLKRAGFDQVVVTGRAEKPVYLLLDDGEATLMDAASLSGLDTWETTDRLKEAHGEGISVACIGQAGEHRVRFASLIFDRYSSAAPGSGAVMGSKNLKAVVARGTRTPALAVPGEFRDLAREDRKYFLEDPFFRDQVGKVGSPGRGGGLGAGLPEQPGTVVEKRCARRPPGASLEAVRDRADRVPRMPGAMQERVPHPLRQPCR